MDKHTDGAGTGYTMPDRVSFVDGSFVDDRKVFHTWVGIDGRLYGGKDFCNELSRRYNSQPDLLQACKIMRDRIAEMANKSDACWLDWPGAYEVDDAIAKAEGN